MFPKQCKSFNKTFDETETLQSKYGTISLRSTLTHSGCKDRAMLDLKGKVLMTAEELVSVEESSSAPCARYGGR